MFINTTLVELKKVKIRKAHVCHKCNIMRLAGDTMFSFTVESDTLKTFYLCEDCEKTFLDVQKSLDKIENVKKDDRPKLTGSINQILSERRRMRNNSNN